MRFEFVLLVVQLVHTVSNWHGCKGHKLIFWGGILYLWHSSGKALHSDFKGFLFFSPWEHVIVTYYFCCSWGYCTFLVISFLLFLSTYVTTFLCVSVCDEERAFQGHSKSWNSWIWSSEIFPVCWAAGASSLDVSVTHSFVLWPKAKSPVIPRNIFYGQNFNVPSKLNVPLKKKQNQNQLNYNCSVWLFSPSFSASHCDYQPYLSSQIRDSFSDEGHCGIITNFLMFLPMNSSPNFWQYSHRITGRLVCLPFFLNF